MEVDFEVEDDLGLVEMTVVVDGITAVEEVEVVTRVEEGVTVTVELNTPAPRQS